MGEIDRELGVGRRDLLKRGAVVGGALVWAAPTVQTINMSSALAQTTGGGGTPKDLSYVAFCYQCANGQICCVKFELDGNGASTGCEGGDFQTPQCESSTTVDDGNNAGCGNCALFSVSSNDGGQTVTVNFVTGADASCAIIEGMGVGKCGNPENPQSGGECVPGVVTNAGRTISFGLCGD